MRIVIALFIFKQHPLLGLLPSKKKWVDFILMIALVSMANEWPMQRTSIQNKRVK